VIEIKRLMRSGTVEKGIQNKRMREKEETHEFKSPISDEGEKKQILTKCTRIDRELGIELRCDKAKTRELENLGGRPENPMWGALWVLYKCRKT